MRKYFDTKDPQESVSLTFDFALMALALVGPATVAVTVDAGTDPAPASLLNGSATIIGPLVKVPVTGGVAGADYRIEVRCDGMVLVGFLPVREE